jgi:hypothetical protein
VTKARFLSQKQWEKTQRLLFFDNTNKLWWGLRLPIALCLCALTQNIFFNLEFYSRTTNNTAKKGLNMVFDDFVCFMAE